MPNGPHALIALVLVATVGLAGLTSLAGCSTSEPEHPSVTPPRKPGAALQAPALPSAVTAIDATPEIAADRSALVVFLRRQGGPLADLDVSTLSDVRAVRLDADYTDADLRLLHNLPELREVMIWRDGEGRPGSEGAAAPTDADLELLATLTQVETLRLGGWSAPFTDAGVARLARMPALRRLDLIQAQGITDAAMKSVASMPALESLAITYTKISDAGLTHLVASESLTSVRYGWAGESERWLAAFRRAQPETGFRIN